MQPAEVSSTKLTYDDYLLFPDDGRRHELIDGEHYVTPSPSLRHQRISRRFATAFDDFLRAHPLGEVFYAPLDVVPTDVDVVEPDVLCVSNERAGILGDPIRGAPDLVIEIVSPSSRRTDEVVKRKLYERIGVCEYLGRRPGTGRGQGVPAREWEIHTHRRVLTRGRPHAANATPAGSVDLARRAVSLSPARSVELRSFPIPVNERIKSTFGSRNVRRCPAAPALRLTPAHISRPHAGGRVVAAWRRVRSLSERESSARRASVGRERSPAHRGVRQSAEDNPGGAGRWLPPGQDPPCGLSAEPLSVGS